jgi:DNA polymerase sigma
MSSIDKKVARQDLVDNSIFNLLLEVNPTNKEIEWNIELIGKIRDLIAEVIVDELKLCDEDLFYPKLED